MLNAAPLSIFASREMRPPWRWTSTREIASPSPTPATPVEREAMRHQIQQLVHERVRFAPIWEYIWPSGVGPRVEEPALMLINPYPWSAPLEEVRLKKR